MTVPAARDDPARPDPGSHADMRPALLTASLAEGFDRMRLSRYGDAQWDLTPAVFRGNAPRSHASCDFAAIEHDDVRETLRAFLHARLNVDIPGRRSRIPPTRLRTVFHHARRFLEFVRLRRGAVDLPRVEQALLDDYARTLRDDRRRQPAAVAHLLDVVVDFHLYRERLPRGGLGFEPWGGGAATAAGFTVARVGGAVENRTPRMPEAVITPLLAWSLRYVTQFSHDIFAARAELVALEARRHALRAGEAGLTDGERRRRHRDRLDAYFDRLRREGRGVPLWTYAHNGDVRGDPGAGDTTPPVNAHLLHLHMGVDVQVEPRFHVMLTTGEPAIVEQAIGALGVETGGFDTVPSAGPDGVRPWRPRFDVKTLAEEERMLQAAAYVVCAYLSGMRDCEVQAMKRGCASVDRGEDGLVVRHRLRSTIYKRKATGGEPATWVTIAPVADAIAVLERLAAKAPGAEASDTLWPVLTRQASGKAQVANTIVRQLNAYLEHLDGLAAASGDPAIPPGPDGQRWHVTTRQFRRTIAWHIANRPFGAVAGMIQYKHASVAAFEGYAGSTASGFRAEIEAERRLGQIEDVLAHFDARQGGGALSGPAGPRVGRALDAVADNLGPLPAMLANRGRLRVLLADLARTLHVGVLADCFFDPSTALCLKHLGAPDAVGPRTALCEPTRCPNACIAERHRPAWARAAAEARTLLREKRLSSPQRLALDREIDRVEAVLDGIDAPSGR